jgi:hypothetical protein
LFFKNSTQPGVIHVNATIRAYFGCIGSGVWHLQLVPRELPRGGRRTFDLNHAIKGRAADAGAKGEEARK